MANYFILTLDTLPPQGLTLEINGGAIYTANRTVTLGIHTNDADTTGYQMMIWGIDGIANEANAVWETFSAVKTVTLTDGDGLKTVYIKIRDDLHNTTAAASAAITLDNAVPVVSITGPDVSRVSKISGRNVSAFGFMANVNFTEYMVRVVPSENSLHTSGTLIPTTNGSANMSGTGTFAANTAIQASINGADLELSDSGDGVKVVKVFVKTASGTWSV